MPLASPLFENVVPDVEPTGFGSQTPAAALTMRSPMAPATAGHVSATRALLAAAERLIGASTGAAGVGTRGVVVPAAACAGVTT